MPSTNTTLISQDSLMCLTQSGSTFVDGVCATGNPVDTFKLAEQSDGTYLIQNLATNQCLDSQGGGVDFGTVMVPATCSASSGSQRFNILPSQFGYYVQQLKSQMCLQKAGFNGLPNPTLFYCAGITQSYKFSTQPAYATPQPTIAYNDTQACVGGVLYTVDKDPDVLPETIAASHGVGEFNVDGFDRNFWCNRVKSNPLNNPLAPFSGCQSSWGRYQYDTYFGDLSDGLGVDPFYVGADVDAPHAPQGLRISAMPMPDALKNVLKMYVTWPLAHSTASMVMPTIGSTVTMPVDSSASINVGGTFGPWINTGADTFYGTVLSKTANSVTVQVLQNFGGVPGSTIPTNAELRYFSIPNYYAGMLDTMINLQYGLFISRIRTPPPSPAISPAFWMLSGQGMGSNGNGLNLSGEWDIQEMFSNEVGTNGNGINQGTILWNSGNQNWGGSFDWPKYQTTLPSQDYHDYGVVLAPGGVAWGGPYDGSKPGPGQVFGTANSGVTNYIDGFAIPGHAGGADITQGVSWKEMMAMFQVGNPGGWLDTGAKRMTSTNYYWLQWIRVYKPTTQSCTLGQISNPQ